MLRAVAVVDPVLDSSVRAPAVDRQEVRGTAPEAGRGGASAARLSNRCARTRTVYPRAPARCAAYACYSKQWVCEARSDMNIIDRPQPRAAKARSSPHRRFCRPDAVNTATWRPGSLDRESARRYARPMPSSPK